MKRLLVMLILVTTCSHVLACPMCKDSVPNREGAFNELHDSYSTGGQNISGGINTSVYVMLGAVLGMMGLVSAVIVKGVRSSGVSGGLVRDPKDESQDLLP
jgi:hypothetical protein